MRGLDRAAARGARSGRTSSVRICCRLTSTQVALASGPLRYRELIASRRPPRPGAANFRRLRPAASLDRPPALRPWRTADQPSSA